MMNDIQQIARRTVASFWDSYSSTGMPQIDAIRLLAKIANLEDPQLARQGTTALFRDVIEPLNDAFSETHCRTYDRLFAEVIQQTRRYSPCTELDQQLSHRGLDSAGDIFRRKRRITRAAPLDEETFNDIKKIVVLSRVTIGADVAITTVLLDNAHCRFPEAEVVFLAPRASRYITAGHPQIRHHAIPYERHGRLATRLNAWGELLEIVQEQICDLNCQEYLIIDPDSRLTQLGLLPIADDSRYLFFPSRSYTEGTGAALGELAAHWMSTCTGTNGSAGPRIWLSREDHAWGERLRHRLSQVHSGPVVSVSFGVGGDQQKRISETFERHLLRWLVGQGYLVLLTRGVGQTETTRTYTLTRRLADMGVQVIHCEKGRTIDGLNGHDPAIVTWEADLGAFCASIAGSDCYIGYDSAGQHIAAALGVPTLTVFRAASGTRHLKRWTPCGQGAVRVVAVDSSDSDEENILHQVQAQLHALSGYSSYYG